MLRTLIECFRLLGFSRLQFLGNMFLIVAAAYSALFYTGFDFKIRPKIGVIKLFQKWEIKAIVFLVASFLLKILLEFSGFTLSVAPGLLAFKASLLLDGVLPALWGIPAAYGLGLGAALSDMILYGYSTRSMSYLYWGIASYNILFKFYGENPAMRSMKSWLSYTCGWWCWAVGTGVVWTTTITLEGRIPLEVAWSAYLGLVILVMMTLYVLNMVFLYLSYPIVKKYGLYWRDRPDYYTYVYVFPADKG